MRSRLSIAVPRSGGHIASLLALPRTGAVVPSPCCHLRRRSYTSPYSPRSGQNEKGFINALGARGAVKVDLAEKDFPPPPPPQAERRADQWESLKAAALTYAQHGQMKEADAVLQHALKMAEENTAQATWLAKIHRERAELYYLYGGHDLVAQATAACQRAVELLEENANNNHHHNINDNDNDNVESLFSSLNMLAHLHWDQGQDDRARQVWARLRRLPGVVRPLNARSRCLRTQMMGVSFVHSAADPALVDPIFISELHPRPALPPDAFLEVFFENPEDPTGAFIREEKQLTPGGDGGPTIVLTSPPVRKLERGRTYEMAAHVYSDRGRTRKLGEHHQLCLSTITSDGIRTMEDVMAAMQKNRNTTGVVECDLRSW